MIITDATLEALRTELRRQFSDAYEGMQAQTFYRDVAMVIPSTTKSNTYPWLGDFPDLIEWVGERTVKDMSETGYQIDNKKYEGTVSVDRTDIEDDNLSLYGTMSRRMGSAAARHPDQLITELMNTGNAALCYDGQNFFDIDHPVFPNHDGTGTATTVANYDDGTGGDGTATPGPAWYLLDVSDEAKPFIFQERTQPEFVSRDDPNRSDSVFMSDKYRYGVRYRCNAGFGFWQKAYMSRAPLSEANFDAAMAAMMRFKADGNRPLGIMPSLLVVPPALRSDANKTINVMFGTGGASNPNYGAVDVKVVNWLTA